MGKVAGRTSELAMDQMGNQAKMAAGTMFPVDRKKSRDPRVKASSGSTSVLGLGHDPPGRMHWKLKKHRREENSMMIETPGAAASPRYDTISDSCSEPPGWNYRNQSVDPTVESLFLSPPIFSHAAAGASEG